MVGFHHKLPLRITPSPYHITPQLRQIYVHFNYYQVYKWITDY